MSRNIDFGRVKEERKKFSFFKIFQKADLSSESMRAFPYNFISTASYKAFSSKMVIRAQWGSSWEVVISKTPRFYYIEKCGWNQFVNDNALGENEFVTFTLNGKTCFSVNIYEKNGKEILRPRRPLTIASSSVISYKYVKKEDDLRVRKKKADESKTFKKKKVKETVPEFKIMIKKSYLKSLSIPKSFVEDHIQNESKMFTIHHSNGNNSWEVLLLARKIQTILSSGWTKLAREYPLLIGDMCTFKLIKPTEFLLVISKNA